MNAWPLADPRRVARRLVNIAGFGALVALAVGMCVRYGRLGDYKVDAAPAFEALSKGRLHEFFTSDALMGPFALLARAPFVLVANLGDASMLDHYRWGAIVCMLASAVLALVVGRTMRRAGQPVYVCAFAAVLLVANPIVVKALAFGHPEEMLGAALCTGAMLAAMTRRGILAGILFGLALTTKQWALVIVGPILLAVLVYRLPRWKFAAALLVTCLAATGPFFLSDPGRFLDAQTRAGTIPVTNWQPASPYSIWYLAAPTKSVHIRPVDGRSDIQVRPVPPFVAGIAKKLIVISALLLTLPLLVRRKRLSATDPLLCLAFVLLLRCVLDPFDNVLPPTVPIRLSGMGSADSSWRTGCCIVCLIRVPPANEAGRDIWLDSGLHDSQRRVSRMVASVAGLHDCSSVQPRAGKQNPPSAHGRSAEPEQEAQGSGAWAWRLGAGYVA